MTIDYDYADGQNKQVAVGFERKIRVTSNKSSNHVVVKKRLISLDEWSKAAMAVFNRHPTTELVKLLPISDLSFFTTSGYIPEPVTSSTYFVTPSAGDEITSCW